MEFCGEHSGVFNQSSVLSEMPIKMFSYIKITSFINNNILVKEMSTFLASILDSTLLPPWDKA